MPSPELSPIVVERVLWGLAPLLGVAALVLSVWVARNRGVVGTVEVQVARRRAVRIALVASYAVAAAVLLAFARELPRVPLGLDLALGFYVLWLSPGFQDSKFGSSGVQRGWHARRFGELEEWRLTGDHLRWKLFGVWISSDLPKERHAAVREKLVALVPDRESPFSQ
ncbi:MAG: hypothetical protein K8S98_03275 [Planctomycetes bacterium]|nr:hypothetical protein [Planctomycetota bacterium]